MHLGLHVRLDQPQDMKPKPMNVQRSKPELTPKESRSTQAPFEVRTLNPATINPQAPGRRVTTWLLIAVSMDMLCSSPHVATAWASARAEICQTEVAAEVLVAVAVPVVVVLAVVAVVAVVQ